jgi:hypothetical protein
MFKRFYPGEDALASEVKDVLQSKAVSPAALQGHFLKFPGQPLEALNALPELLVNVDKNDNAPMLIGIWLKRLALPQKLRRAAAPTSRCCLSAISWRSRPPSWSR